MLLHVSSINIWIDVYWYDNGKRSEGFVSYRAALCLLHCHVLWPVEDAWTVKTRWIFLTRPTGSQDKERLLELKSWSKPGENSYFVHLHASWKWGPKSGAHMSTDAAVACRLYVVMRQLKNVNVSENIRQPLYITFLVTCCRFCC